MCKKILLDERARRLYPHQCFLLAVSLVFMLGNACSERGFSLQNYLKGPLSTRMTTATLSHRIRVAAQAPRVSSDKADAFVADVTDAYWASFKAVPARATSAAASSDLRRKRGQEAAAEKRAKKLARIDGSSNRVGNELSGMDVIDDLETEQKEVMCAGNNFITYSNEIHICRMAGCYSIISDLLDEEPLKLFYINKLCKELVGCPKDLPHWENRVEYIQQLNSLNSNVYDLNLDKFTPLLYTSKIDWMIWTYQQKIIFRKYWQRHNYLILFGVVILIGIFIRLFL